MTFRKILMTAHLCVGLVSAPLLIGLGLSGAVLAFEDPLDAALNAHLMRVSPGARTLPLAELQEGALRSSPGARLTAIRLPEDATHPVEISLAPKSGGEGSSVFLNPYTGQVLGTSAEQVTVLRRIHQFHVRLLSGNPGSEVIGWTAVALLLLSISGLILWWPVKLLTVRWRGSGRRLPFELHVALGAYAWIFLMVFAVTGIIVHWEEATQQLLSRVTGSEPRPPLPPETNACAGHPTLSPDQLLAAASAAVPDARATVLRLGQGSAPARVTMKFPEDHTPAGRTNVFVEGCSGKLVQAQPSRSASLAFRIARMWNRELHTGDLLGWPSRLLACAFSLSLPVMSLTGPLSWWTRRRRARAGQRQIQR